MPIYEYRCSDCGAVFEVFQKFSDDPMEICERCSGTVTKVLHPVAIHFKGSGFYTTDYGRGKKSPRPGGDAGEKKGADDTASGGDKGGASTPSSKKEPSGDGGSGALPKVKGTSS